MNAIMGRMLACALGAALLAGCQITNDDQATVTLGQTVRGVLAERLGRGEPQPDARRLLSAQVLDASRTPVMLVVQTAQDTAGVMVPVGTGADGTVQWRDTNGAGVLMRGGVLVGTRGFGFDLLTVDDGELRAALVRGGANDVARTERRLLGDNTLRETDYICDVVPTRQETLTFYGRAFPTTLFEERCAGADRTFVNRYWLGGGLIRKSAILVSQEAGIVEFTVLKD